MLEHKNKLLGPHRRSWYAEAVVRRPSRGAYGPATTAHFYSWGFDPVKHPLKTNDSEGAVVEGGVLSTRYW